MNLFNKITLSVSKSITTERFWDFITAIPQRLGVMTQVNAEAVKEADRVTLESKSDLSKSMQLEAIKELKSLRDTEIFLRDFCGLSRSASKRFLSQMKRLEQI